MNILLVAGARPNFMKVAPIMRTVQTLNRQSTNGQPLIDCRLIHTGQHYDARMSSVFFQELGIREPDFNLSVGSASHAVQTACVMTRFEPVCLELKPDWVVVVGDVNSTMACTLVAAKLGIKVAHVEAGLRSFDRSMPEEINRLVTDALADLLLAPSSDCCENLRREGVPEHKIVLVGNIMIDSLLAGLAGARASGVLHENQVSKGGYAYVTLHRPSNVDDQATLSAIMRELKGLSASLPVVFPMHPRTRQRLSHFGIHCVSDRRLKIIEPVGYYDSLCLTENARFVLTDSGGLQEETTYLRVPCLTLRPNTERPITVTLGSNRLTTLARLPQDISQILARNDLVGQVPPLWDGRTGERIVSCLLERRADG
jgi:UDP-N-acetylglucosamine 2-epimerase (non-hydrolysing)